MPREVPVDTFAGAGLLGEPAGPDLSAASHGAEAISGRRDGELPRASAPLRHCSLVIAETTAWKTIPMSSTLASWSNSMPSRRITARLRRFGASVMEITRGRFSVPNPWSSQPVAASVA
jgi:hypothetical protein